MRGLVVVPLVLCALVIAGSRESAAAGAGDPRPAPREPGSYVLAVTDSGVTRLGEAGSVAVLSPDGALAAVATPEGAEAGLRIIDLASGAVSVPLASEAGRVDTPFWSPDGRLLAFNFGRFGRPDSAAVPPTGLYIVDPRTRETVQVFRDPPLIWTWGADSRSITGLTFEAGDDGARYGIVDLPIDTGAAPRTLLEPSTTICPTAFAWSADRRRLAFQSGAFRQGCGETEALGLWLWEASTGSVRQLTRGALYVGVAWTADSRILSRRIGSFDTSGARPAARPDAIVLVDPDGAETMLAAAPATPFPFVPFQETAGDTVIYHEANCNAGAVFAVTLAGSAPRRLSDAAVAAAVPRLAPDGRSVAWVAALPEASDLQIARTDGSGTRTLLAGAPGLDLTGWSGDGRRLTFTVGETGALVCPDS
jgi:Tol biopolymer transport system component